MSAIRCYESADAIVYFRGDTLRAEWLLLADLLALDPFQQYPNTMVEALRMFTGEL